jgi:hypothetical protein
MGRTCRRAKTAQRGERRKEASRRRGRITFFESF